MRSGRYITQPNQYKAFIPTNLPPEPPIRVEGEMQSLLTDANIAIGKLDAMGYLAPNLNHIIAMYVRKEALLSFYSTSPKRSDSCHGRTRAFST